MLQAAAFGGGLALQQSLEQVRLPKLRRAADGSATFKLSVRVLGASVPGLEAPGLTSRQRPFLEVTLGSTKKETEFADFDSSLDSGVAGAGAHECPWRFSDTLTFSTKLQDVTGPGLKLNLRAKKELTLGFLQMEMQAGEIGDGAVDLRQRALPACVQERLSGDGRVLGWSSPMVLVPLSHVRGGICGGAGRLGEAVAHVALVFTVDVDPEEILTAAGAGRNVQVSLERTVEEAGRRFEAAERQLERHVASTKQSLCEAKRKLEEHGNRTLQRIEETERRLDGQLGRIEQKLTEPVARWAAKVEQMMSPVDGDAASARADARLAPGASQPLPDPDFDPDGWICRLGPNGQAYWHHQALGPAPWESSSDGSTPARRLSTSSAGSRTGGAARAGHPEGSFLPTPPASLKRVSNAVQASVGWLAGQAGNSNPAAPRRAPGMHSPDEAPEGWVCHHGADGRVFWHNTALGPPPWEGIKEA